MADAPDIRPDAARTMDHDAALARVRADPSRLVMLPLRWTEHAVMQLEGIVDYISATSPVYGGGVGVAAPGSFR